MIEIWRGTQEAEGTGFEYQQAGNSRAGVQIPLSPPFKPLESNGLRVFYYIRAIIVLFCYLLSEFSISEKGYIKKSPCNERFSFIDIIHLKAVMERLNAF